MLVGSLLLALYPHEPASHEYLRKPEKVTTACLLSIWHFCMSLLPLSVHVILLGFLSFSPWHSARSPFFLAWLIWGGGERKGDERGERGRWGKKIKGRCFYSLSQVKSCMYFEQIWGGSFPIFCACVCESLQKPITQEWVSEHPRWPVYTSVGFAGLGTWVELGWQPPQGEVNLFSWESLASTD